MQIQQYLHLNSHSNLRNTWLSVILHWQDIPLYVEKHKDHSRKDNPHLAFIYIFRPERHKQAGIKGIQWKAFFRKAFCFCIFPPITDRIHVYNMIKEKVCDESEQLRWRNILRLAQGCAAALWTYYQVIVSRLPRHNQTPCWLPALISHAVNTGCVFYWQNFSQLCSKQSFDACKKDHWVTDCDPTIWSLQNHQSTVSISVKRFWWPV